MLDDEIENDDQFMENEVYYRDRAEERRKGQQMEQLKGDFVQLEGFEKDIKVNGLDYNLIQQQNKIEDKLNIIAKIKNDLFKVKENIPKKTTNPMALKIEAFLQKKEQKQIKNTMTYFYKYDIDPNFGNSMPQFFTKKKDLDEEETICVQIDQTSIEMISDSLIQTNYFQKKRYQERFQFDQNAIIPVNQINEDDDDESEDIFQDAKQVEKPQVDVKKILEVEIEDQNFDLKDYLQNNMFDQRQYNQYKQQIEQESKEKEEKLKKHKKMLEGGDDYYYECYQPIGLTIDEEKEHKQEVDTKKQVDPNYKDMDFIKQDFQKRKKKRVNLQAQLDKIEDILQKKKK